MIIVGYQGIGKTSLAAWYDQCIDLESSNFFVDGVRPENWHVMYCKTAISLSTQGYYVFMSSHKVVRDYLAEHCPPEDLMLIYPCRSLKDQWIKKLKTRFDITGLDKDYRAWKNAEECYESNIRELSEQQGFARLALTGMNYQLKSYFDLD